MVPSQFLKEAASWQHRKISGLKRQQIQNSLASTQSIMTMANTTTGHSCFAGRFPAGTEHPVTLNKNGVRHTVRMPDGSTREVLAVGLACSECFSGPNLAKVLAPGYEYEGQVMKALAQGQPAPPLAIHTSSGVPEALEGFLKALQVHLPWKNKEELDWCVSLQIEGASAVWAAIDMVLQVSMFEGSHDENRVKVAVGATSYHGPPSTCFGSKSPLWHKHHQLIYPVPTAYGSYDEAELLQKYQVFLDKHAHEIGVMLFEPQVRHFSTSLYARGYYTNFDVAGQCSTF